MILVPERELISVCQHFIFCFHIMDIFLPLSICGKVNGADAEQGRVKNIHDADPEKLKSQAEYISMGLRLGNWQLPLNLLFIIKTIFQEGKQ